MQSGTFHCGRARISPRARRGDSARRSGRATFAGSGVARSIAPLSAVKNKSANRTGTESKGGRRCIRRQWCSSEDGTVGLTAAGCEGEAPRSEWAFRLVHCGSIVVMFILMIYRE
ncbi:hypothetical protein EVAR_20184_1 [Eumeta japonica]|uniref:Uncharacterized protein n=1 Tax=Eumeta variegata TaxID=151549 RepID=A0A4C1UTU2_EUMVA|nr:hypothetical protein EVAR_20184_1 [Eumeta japonica]